MVSPISIPRFPSMHTRQSAATCDAALFARQSNPPRLLAMDARVSAAIDSFEASVRAAFHEALDSALIAADLAVRRALAPLRHNLTLIAGGQSTPALMFSADGESHDLGHIRLQGVGKQPRIPSPVEVHSVPPLFSSSPLLREIAAPSVKPHSKDSAAATILLLESKRGIHASTMTCAPRLLHEHSFSDTTKNGPEEFCAWNLLDEIPYSSCYAVLDRDMCYCNGIRDKGGGSKIRPLEDYRMKLGKKIAQPVYDDNIGYFIKKKLHVWYQLLSGLWELRMVRGHEVLLLFGVIACSTGHRAIVYHVLLNAKYGWVNWYLVGKFVKKNFYALHLFDEMSKKYNMENMSLSSNMEVLDVVVLVCRSWPKDLAASFTEAIGTLGHINAIKQFLCVSFLQIFLQLGWCHTLTHPYDKIFYQKVVFNQRNKFNRRNYTIWWMKKPCILLSFKVVKENGKRKGFRVVQFDKEDSGIAAASALNDTISKGKKLYVLIFVQKCKNDNRLQIFSNTLNPALYQEVVCCMGLELATNITEACNNRVFGQIVLLLVQIVTTMIRLLDNSANLKGLQDGHFRQEEEAFVVLNQKHRNDPLKIKEVISMVANSLTSLRNLDIEVKLLLQGDGTTPASILLFLFHGIHSNERGKSGTKEALQFVAETTQQCGTVNAVRQYLWSFEEFPPKVVYAYVDSFHFRGRVFDEAWFHRFAGKFKEKYKIDVFQNARACFHLCTACEMLKKVLRANHDAPLNTECLLEEKVFSRMKLTSILGLFHDNSVYIEMTDESLMSYKGKSNENECLINRIESSKHIDFSSGGVTSALRITGLQSSLTAVFLLLLKNADARENVLKYLVEVINRYSSWAHIQVDPLPCDISKFEYQWHVPSHQNAWKQITKEDSYNGQFRGQFHFVFIEANRTSVFNTKAEIALNENFATVATLLVAARFKQVPTVSFLSLEDKANFQGGNIVMNPICD